MRNALLSVTVLLGLAGCVGVVGAPEDDDGPPGSELTCTTTASPGAPVPMRRLTAVQVQRSVLDVLGVNAPLDVSDERLFTFRSNVSSSVDFAGARGYLDFAEAAVALTDLTTCATAPCTDWLFDDIGARLFRRPLTSDEKVRYQALFDEGELEDGPTEGARWVLEAMLQSPTFLYLDEVSDADGYLDDLSIASRLSLALWGSNPDAELLARALEGKLSSPEQIRAEAERMLADPRSVGGLTDFVDQWLRLDRLNDPDARPDLEALGAETIAAMRSEPVQLFRLLATTGGDLEGLLTSSRTAALAPMEAVYGADIVKTSTDAFDLDPTRRAGILSLPGVMAALSHSGATSPTLRGHAVLANFLCTPPKPPPSGISVTLPEIGPGKSTRERLEAHFSNETCAACHQTMDGLGFAFESYDWLGMSRDTEFGKPIDDKSTFTLGSEEVTVDGAVDLASTMAESASVSTCVARQWASYGGGMPDQPEAKCLVESLARDLESPDGLRTMILTFVTSDWFRRGPGESK